MDTQVNPVKKTGLQIWFTNKYKGAQGTACVPWAHIYKCACTHDLKLGSILVG